jgi:hypothetical protein
MRYEDMLIDTPYTLAEIENRDLKPGHPHENQCTFCLKLDNTAWYAVEDIEVVRIWKINSVYTPEKGGANSGGWYSWRCPSHNYDGKPSLYAENAPEHLRPKHTDRCQALVLGRACGESAVGQYDGKWLCEDHARPIVLRLRAEELLRGDDVE